MNRPRLILITGPSGVGKTTLSHALSRRIGCPVISRDEIKEGMVVNAPDFASAPGDPLTVRTFDVFFDALRLLVDALVIFYWAAEGLPDLSNWSDPWVMGDLALRVPAMVLCLMIWVIYLGLGLVPRVRAEREAAAESEAKVGEVVFSSES